MGILSKIQNEIKLSILNPDSVVFKDSVRAVSSFNEMGPFDILPYHANFISIIKQSITIRPLQGQDKVIPIDVGVLKVQENEVVILLGIQLSS